MLKSVLTIAKEIFKCVLPDFILFDVSVDENHAFNLIVNAVFDEVVL